MNGARPQPVDLTTLNADAPVPANRNHEIFRHQMPDELQSFNPLRFALLELQVKNLIASHIAMLEELNELKRGK